MPRVMGAGTFRLLLLPCFDQR